MYLGHVWYRLTKSYFRIWLQTEHTKKMSTSFIAVYLFLYIFHENILQKLSETCLTSKLDTQMWHIKRWYGYTKIVFNRLHLKQQI